MAASLSWGLLFYYLNVFFGVFEEQQQEDQFGKELDKVCIDLGICVNDGKKQLGCLVDFLGLEFDTL